MTYKAHISGGVIVPDEPINLPDGTHVIVETNESTANDPTGIAGSWVDNRSAEEIIMDIYNSRHSKP